MIYTSKHITKIILFFFAFYNCSILCMEYIEKVLPERTTNRNKDCYQFLSKNRIAIPTNIGAQTAATASTIARLIFTYKCAQKLVEHDNFDTQHYNNIKMGAAAGAAWTIGSLLFLYYCNTNNTKNN